MQVDREQILCVPHEVLDACTSKLCEASHNFDTLRE